MLRGLPGGNRGDLTATAAAGSTFSGWTGGGCPGTGTCRVMLTANTAVTATFSPPAGPPAFAIGPTSASPNPVARGATTTVTAAVTDTGGAAAGIIVDLEIYNAAGAQVLQRITSSQSFQAGERKTFQWTWTVPASQPTGPYTVKIGIFSADWATLYTWDNQATSLTVGPKDFSGGSRKTPPMPPQEGLRRRRRRSDAPRGHCPDGPGSCFSDRLLALIGNS